MSPKKSTKNGRGTEELADQYLDIAEFLLSHPDTVVSAHDYMAWEKRNTSLDWNPNDATTAAARVQDRFDQLGVAVTLPARPKVSSEHKKALWVQALHDAGAVYRTGHGKSGTYVLDTKAHWVSKQRSGGRRAELLGNRWDHTPNARVRDAMGTLTIHPTVDAPPGIPTPETVQLDSVDPTPDELRSAAEAASASGTRVSLAGATFTVEAAGQHVGDQLVVRVETPDGAGALLIATVATVLPVVR